MGNEKICEKCRSRSVVDGRCTNCGSKQNKQYSTNALPNGHLLNNGRYRIEQVLGEGGYGITYVALDLRQRKKVAIKEFFPPYVLRRSDDCADAVCKEGKAETDVAHIRMRFNQEAALLITLKNIQEIVTVYHSFEDNKTAYYTMELLQGMDMQKHLQMHGRMFWHELSPIVIQILRALYVTHQMGYIHRDVTPDNIFLLGNGSARLIDFGNARRYRENQQLTAVVKDKFAPREQYSRRGRQGPWTDIYSLSVTIYYAMTSILPKKATERKSAVDALPPLHTVADVPQSVSRAVQIGMSTDENKRYQSIADFAYALYPGQTVLGEVARQMPVQQAAHRSPGTNAQEKPFQARQSVTMPVQRQSDSQKQQRPKQKEMPGKGNVPMLVCTQGIMKGFRMNLPVGRVQSIGREPGKMIQYPDKSGGVSRNQCSILLHANGAVYVRDDGSTFGTTVNGQKLVPGIWRPLRRGDTIAFGREMYILY